MSSDRQVVTLASLQGLLAFPLYQIIFLSRGVSKYTMTSDREFCQQVLLTVLPTTLHTASALSILDKTQATCIHSLLHQPGNLQQIDIHGLDVCAWNNRIGFKFPSLGVTLMPGSRFHSHFQRATTDTQARPSVLWSQGNKSDGLDSSYRCTRCRINVFYRSCITGARRVCTNAAV